VSKAISRAGAPLRDQEMLPAAAARRISLSPGRSLARWSRTLGLSKLSARLLLLVLLAAVPVFAVQVYGQLEQREQRRAEAAGQVRQMAELVVAQLDRTIEGAETLLASLGDYPAIAARDGEACTDLLVRLSRRFPHLAVVTAVTTQGAPFCSTSPAMLRVNIADREYFRRAVAQKATTVSNLVTGRASDRSILVITQPILDDTGAVETVMVLSLYPERISALLARVPLPEGAVMGVVDRAGRVVARVPYAPEIVGERVTNERFPRTLFGRAAGAEVLEGPTGVRRIYGFARSRKATNLAAYTGLAQETIFAAAERQFIRALAVTGAAFLLAAGAALLFGGQAIRRPILEVRGAIDRMAYGDLSARDDQERSGIEELAGLARSFDEMARKRAEAEQRQRVLLGELNHRIKNSYALVRSIATLTLHHSASVEAFEQAFIGRLDALARVSTLVTADPEETADLRALAEAAVEPHRAGGNLRLSGPAIMLPSRLARTLSLALHELATNAVKYGALSVPEGRVELTWRVEDRPEGRRLLIEWAEHGGPEVRPPDRHGFGRVLIERSVAYELGGTARLEFPPAGVRCRIEVPLPAAVP
jgi:two-component sensor histidine kinase